MFDAGGTPTVCRRSLLVDLDKAPKDYVFESYILYKSRKTKSRVIRPGVNYGCANLVHHIGNEDFLVN